MATKKLFKIAYGRPRMCEGFLNVLAVNRKAADQQVRKKTGKKVLRQNKMEEDECNWCGNKIEIREAIRFEGVYFCSSKCLDECRAIQ